MTQPPAPPATAAQDPTVKRLRYYYGQFLQAEDFTDEQQYHIDQRQRLTRLIQTPGILEGLTLTTQAQPSGTLLISKGTAVDGNGRLIVLASDQSFPVVGAPSAPSTTMVLTIAYAEQASDLAPDEPKGDTRFSEIPLLALYDPDSDQAQAPDMYIQLAKLSFPQGAWDGQADPSVRVAAGLRTGGQASVGGNLSVAGPLSVSQSATVGGTLGVSGLVTANGGLTVGGGNLSVSSGSLTIGASTAVTGFSDSSDFDTNPSVSIVPTQKAVQAYVTNKISGEASGGDLASLKSQVDAIAKDYITSTTLESYAKLSADVSFGQLTCGTFGDASENPQTGIIGATVKGNYGLLALEGYNSTYITWSATQINGGNPMAYVGFPSAGTSDFYITNEANSNRADWPVLVLKGDSETFEVHADLSVTGATGAAVVVVPPGAGWIQVGNRETGADDYTSVSMGITSEKNGTAYIQGISAAGSGNYGYLWINPHGQGAIIGPDPNLPNDDLSKLDSSQAGSNTLFVFGSIGSSVGKQFVIPHPTRAGYSLSHASLEGPELGVYYRGVARLRHGRANVRLPEYFDALTHADGRTVQLTPVGEQPFLLSYTPVVDGVFTVYGDRADGVFSWQVMAVRADVPPLEVEVINDQQHEKE